MIKEIENFSSKYGLFYQTFVSLYKLPFWLYVLLFINTTFLLVNSNTSLVKRKKNVQRASLSLHAQVQTKMKQISLFFLAVLLFSCGQKQQNKGIKPFNVTKIAVADLPADIQYEGNVQDAFRWQDQEGEHIFISTLTDIVNTVPDDEMFSNREQFLYGYLYTLQNKKNVLQWKVTDYIKECDLEIFVSYAKPCEITDLDQNGIAEVWMMYFLHCAGDVSPSTMKIIMYEGKQKHAMRGNSRVFLGEDPDGTKYFDGGDYQLDKAFKKAPEAIQNYAIEMWKNNMNENF